MREFFTAKIGVENKFTEVTLAAVESTGELTEVKFDCGGNKHSFVREW